MKPWLMTFDCSEFWHTEMPILEKAKLMQARLARFRPRVEKRLAEFDLLRFDELCDDLGCVVDPEMTVDDFDGWLDQLYDWADEARVWVETVQRKAVTP